MGVQPPADAIHLSWGELDKAVERLAAEIGALAATEQPEAILAVSRGGLVPGAMLAYRMGLRDLLVAVAEHYDASGRRVAAAEAAGAKVRTAVLHYKPERSEVDRAPDHFADTATSWVIYPYKGGE